jgi:23S rRNA pseudouridine2605 synthase
MRVQRFLARAGVASRRGSEDLMTAGRVRINGEVVCELGARVDPLMDTVEVDGRIVTLASAPTYLVLNKPAGYVTTMNDPQGRPTVADLVPRDPAGLFPVGRLDRDTTGLLLFTTDGDLAYRLLHPRFHVEKVYRVSVEGRPSRTALDALAAGVQLDDGMTALARVRLIDIGPPAEVEIAIREGRKRQVRRMFAAVGHPVIALHRASFGPVILGDLAPGAHRHLGPEEIAALKRATEEEG